MKNTYNIILYKNLNLDNKYTIDSNIKCNINLDNYNDIKDITLYNCKSDIIFNKKTIRQIRGSNFIFKKMQMNNISFSRGCIFNYYSILAPSNYNKILRRFYSIDRSSNSNSNSNSNNKISFNNSKKSSEGVILTTTNNTGDNKFDDVINDSNNDNITSDVRLLHNENIYKDIFYIDNNRNIVIKDISKLKMIIEEESLKNSDIPHYMKKNLKNSFAESVNSVFKLISSIPQDKDYDVAISNVFPLFISIFLLAYLHKNIDDNPEEKRQDYLNYFENINDDIFSDEKGKNKLKSVFTSLTDTVFNGFESELFNEILHLYNLNDERFILDIKNVNNILKNIKSRCTKDNITFSKKDLYDIKVNLKFLFRHKKLRSVLFEEYNNSGKNIIDCFITGINNESKESYKDFINLYLHEFKNIIDGVVNNMFKDIFFNINTMVARCNQVLNFDILDVLTNLFRNFPSLYYGTEIYKKINDVNDIRKTERMVQIESLGKNYMLQLHSLNKTVIEEDSKISYTKKINKFIDGNGLYLKINNIINRDNVEDMDKQLMLENTLLDFDLNYFEHNKNKSLDVRSNILHEMYPRTFKYLDKLTNEYTVNKYEKLIKILKSNNTNKYGDGLAILVILYLGFDQVISVCFNTILDILSNFDSEKNKIGVDQTAIIMKTGRKLYKTAIWMKTANMEKLEQLKIFKDLGVKEKIKDGELNDNYILILGQVCLDIIIKENDIFERVLVYDDNNIKDSRVEINIKDLYRNKLISGTINVTQLPMLVPPKEYDAEKNVYLPYLKGEVFHIYNTFDSIVKNNYKNLFNTTGEKKIINTINHLNNTKFSINKMMLDFVMTEWENGDSIIFEGYNKLMDENNDPDIIEYYSDLAKAKDKSDKTTIKNINNKIIKKLREIRAHNSKFWYYFNVISIAYVYRNVGFYLPTFSDFRGRIYPLAQYLTYQGGDLSRSLLLFEDEKNEITSEGLDVLFVYLANLGGESKNSIYNKKKWGVENVIDTLKSFRSVHVQSIDDKNNYIFKAWSQNIGDKSEDRELLTNWQNILKKSGEPFQFISILLAFERYAKGFKNIKNPILFDASCSGLQHLSALTREWELAILTNLVTENKLNSSKEKPKDYYGVVAEHINKALIDDPKFNLINFNRSMVKKPVMTVAYNVTPIGIKDQLKDIFTPINLDKLEPIWKNSADSNLLKSNDTKLTNETTEDIEAIIKIKDKLSKTQLMSKVPVLYEVKSSDTKNNKQLILTDSDLMSLAVHLHTIINFNLPLKKLNEYFYEMIDILSSMNKGIFWITPAGLKISLSYSKFESKKTKSRLLPHSKEITISLPTNDIDSLAQKRSFMPNFIHSLDACNIHLLFNSIYKSSNLREKPSQRIPAYTVHDCFASTPNHMSELEKHVKECFIKIYFKDEGYLAKMHTSLEQQIKSLGHMLDEKRIAVNIDGKEKIFTIPELPEEFKSPEKNKDFIKGMFNSRYFIS